MPVRLLKFALSRKHPEPRMFARHDRLKPSYDVVSLVVAGIGWRQPITWPVIMAYECRSSRGPWLDPIIVSGSLHVYVSQSARGELVMDAALDPYELHSTLLDVGHDLGGLFINESSGQRSST